MLAITHMAREVRQYRELLWALTLRDIKIKYKQAAFGVLWVFFMPLLAIASGVLFRVAMAYFSGRELVLADVLAVMVKSLPWVLFAGIVSGSSNSLVSNMGLITKIYFPREVVPLSAAMSTLFDFSISLTGLVVLMAGAGLASSAVAATLQFTPWLLLVPVLLATLIVMALGLGLLLSAANLFFRDVKYIVSVLLQFGVFFSLVFFAYGEVGRYGWTLLFNPVAPLLEALRMCVVGHAAAGGVAAGIDPFLWPFLGYSLAWAVGLLAAGSAFFDRAEYLFAEYA